MWHLGTWLNDGLVSAGLVVGIDDLKDLFPPKQFSDSVTIFSRFFFIEQVSGSRFLL